MTSMEELRKVIGGTVDDVERRARKVLEDPNLPEPERELALNSLKAVSKWREEQPKKEAEVTQHKPSSTDYG